MLDLIDAAQLVVGLLVFEPLLELGLPVAVGAEGKALYGASLGVKPDKLRRHILHRLFDPLPGAAPFIAAQPVQLDGLFIPAADVAGYKVQLGDGDIQHIGAGIADLDIILGDAAHLLLDDALKNADAVRRMNHRHPGGQVGQLPQHLTLLTAGTAAGPGGGAGLCGGDDGPVQLGVFKPGGQTAGQHKYSTLCNIFGGFYKSCGKAAAVQVLGQRQGAPFRPGQQPNRPVPLPVAFQILAKGVQRPAPNRKGIGGDVVQPARRQAGVAAGKAIQNDGGQGGQRLRQHPRFGVKEGAPRCQHPLLQQGGDLLLLPAAAIGQAFLQVDALRKEQQPFPAVAQ